MTKKTISIFILSLALGGTAQAQSFVDAVKDGLSPLTNLVNSEKQAQPADSVDKKNTPKKEVSKQTTKTNNQKIQIKGQLVYFLSFR